MPSYCLHHPKRHVWPYVCRMTVIPYLPCEAALQWGCPHSASSKKSISGLSHHALHPIHLYCRQPSVHRTPEGGKQDTEPGIHLGSLPSAPPLPEHQTHALHAASSSLSPGPGNAQHTLNPSLHASTHSGACVRPSQSQTRQEQGGDQQRHTPSMGAQTGGGSLGPATGGRGQEGVSTEASPAVQPAGSLAWAMQTAAGAPRAAVSALSAWLPWHADSSTSSAPQPEQQLQPQAGLQAAPNSRR